MKWLSQGSRHLCAPYQIVSNIRGFEVWFCTKKRYGVMAREIQTLAKAQAFCEAHKAKAAAADGKQSEISP